MKNYNEVKNVIHNDIGITKDEIIEVFKEIAKYEIQKIVKNDTSYIKQVISDVIKEEMYNAINNQKYPKINRTVWDYGQGDGKVRFQEFVAGIIKEEIIKNMEKQFEVNIDISKK